MKKKLLFAFYFGIMTTMCLWQPAQSQIQVHLSDFDTSQGEAFVTDGSIGTTPWTVSRSGPDWGARIHQQVLKLTNTASATPNENGWVFAHLATQDFEAPYQSVLETNSNKISWYFNMQQIRSNPAGFGSNSYGVAFIIGSTHVQSGTQGSGYAVVLGNTGTPDPLRFVAFDQGIQSLGTTADGLIVADAPLNDPTNQHMSIRLTYEPGSNLWSLYGRVDGSSFQNPEEGELSFLGSIVHDTYTHLDLAYMGAYWQGSTAGNQTAFFDHVSIWIDATGAVPPSISNIIQIPSQDITPETPVSVLADVIEGDAPLASVELRWGLLAGDLEHIIPMTLVQDNTYETSEDIPAQPHNTSVFYRIYAMDEDDVQAFSATQNYLVVDPDIQLAIITVFHPQPIDVEFGTPFHELPLPSTVEVILEDNSHVHLEVSWNEGDYDPQTPADYILTGQLILTEGILNPDQLEAEMMITVLDEVIQPGELIAGWTFPQDDQLADQGTESNIGKTISREADFQGSYAWFSGSLGSSISSTAWAEGEDSKYWMIEISTLSYGDLVVSSKQRSSNTGPRDFKLQYRIGETGTWNDVEQSTITVADNFTSGVLENITLPAACNNKPFLFLRWIMTSNIAVNEGTVAGAGRSNIDEIYIRGEYSDEFKRIVVAIDNPDPLEVEQGTPFEQLELPENVWVTFDDTGSQELEVVWMEGNYDGDITGSYTLYGEIQLEADMENPDNLQAQIIVTVVPEIQFFEITFTVDMSQASEFDPQQDQVFVTGSMLNFAIPGTMPEEQLMHPSGNMTYSKTMLLEEGSYTYKYYINEGLANPEPGPDRYIVLQSDTTLYDMWGVTYVVATGAEQIRLYPNPVNQYLYIHTEMKLSRVVIMDISGSAIQSYTPVTQPYRLDLSTLPSGVYLIQLHAPYRVFTKKVLITG